MKFRFPLQKVLEHRKVLEDLAQKEFQDAMAVLVREQQNLQSMLNKLKIAYDQAFLQQHSKSGQTSEELKQIHEFIIGQKVRIERQRAKIQECENLVEARREILREKAVDYKIMERLKERKKAEFDKEMKIQDQKDTDEINVLRKAHGEPK